MVLVSLILSETVHHDCPEVRNLLSQSLLSACIGNLKRLTAPYLESRAAAQTYTQGKTADCRQLPHSKRALSSPEPSALKWTAKSSPLP